MLFVSGWIALNLAKSLKPLAPRPPLPDRTNRSSLRGRDDPLSPSPPVPRPTRTNVQQQQQQPSHFQPSSPCRSSPNHHQHHHHPTPFRRSLLQSPRNIGQFGQQRPTSGPNWHRQGWNCQRGGCWYRPTVPFRPRTLGDYHRLSHRRRRETEMVGTSQYPTGHVQFTHEPRVDLFGP